MALGTGYHSGWVVTNGIRTHYSWAGTEGPAVVLTHGGGPGSSGEAGWRHTLPALAEAGYRAFAPDQLSMGLTDARPHAWPVLGHQSLVNHVRDFTEALCLDEFAVVGNSQGAYVAAKLALDCPEKVSKAFFIASGTICEAMGIEVVRPKEVQMSLQFDGTADSMRRFLKGILLRESDITDELIEARMAAATRPGVEESRQAFQNYVRDMRSNPKLLNRFRLDDSMPKFAIPAAFIWGKQDRFAPVECGKQLEARLPQIPFEYVDDCGHQVQNDQPKIANEAIIAFLKDK